MNAVQGITFEKDNATHRRYLCVDFDQYGEEITPFLEKIGITSLEWKENKKSLNGNRVQKTYTALDFLDEWSGAFGYLNDEEADRAKYEYLIQKYG